MSSAPSVQDPSLFAVLMAGGSGTRFWPASRTARPKQYLAIGGEEPLLRQTFQRLEGLLPPERVLVVSAAGQEEAVRACLPELPAENLVFEPTARNTAAACALAAVETRRRDPNAVQVVLPADHLIQPPERLRATLAAGAAQARATNSLVTFGIRPTHPATGFGYIELGDELGDRDGHAVHRVSRFVEKPDRERAEQFLATGRFLWNAGIFAWTSETILAEFERFEPGIAGPIAAAIGDREQLERVYPALPSKPVDTAILERADNVLTLPIDYAWNDVGSWSALAEVTEPGANGHWTALRGGAELVDEDAKDCIVWAEGDEVIALVGVSDLVVVRSGDATLVCPRDRAQDVKLIVEQLKRRAGGDRRL